MKKLLLIFVLSSACFVSGKAQYYYDRSKNPDRVVSPRAEKKSRTDNKSDRDFDKFFFLSWDTNKPMSNTDFIGQSSSLGTKLGFRKRLNDEDKLWVGGDFGWAVYKQYMPFQTYQYGTSAVSTDLYNYSYNYSLTANIDYFFFSMEKIVVPYAGFGVGVAYDKFSQYYNIYAGSSDSWGLQIRPEVGVLIGFKANSAWRIKASYHYDYASNASNLVNNNFITPGNNNYTNFINTGFQIGIVKMAW